MNELHSLGKAPRQIPDRRRSGVRDNVRSVRGNLLGRRVYAALKACAFCLVVAALIVGLNFGFLWLMIYLGDKYPWAAI